MKTLLLLPSKLLLLLLLLFLFLLVQVVALVLATMEEALLMLPFGGGFDQTAVAATAVADTDAFGGYTGFAIAEADAFGGRGGTNPGLGAVTANAFGDTGFENGKGFKQSSGFGTDFTAGDSGFGAPPSTERRESITAKERRVSITARERRDSSCQSHYWKEHKH
jgi:hypothetical protein